VPEERTRKAFVEKLGRLARLQIVPCLRACLDYEEPHLNLSAGCPIPQGLTTFIL
jgi:hypothetical protein